AGPDQDRADARLLRLGFPALADSGQEIAPGGRVFGQLLVATVAVVAGGRRADERARLGGAEAGDEVPGADHAAVADAIHLGLRPASRRDGFAREMDDGVGALERGRAVH